MTGLGGGEWKAQVPSRWNIVLSTLVVGTVKVVVLPLQYSVRQYLQCEMNPDAEALVLFNHAFHNNCQMKYRLQLE
jgi:hypothetical protein